MSCPKCGYPYMKRDVPGGLKKAATKGIYTRGQRCGGCGYKARQFCPGCGHPKKKDEPAYRPDEPCVRCHYYNYTGVKTTTEADLQLRFTTPKLAAKSHMLDVNLNVDMALRVHFPGHGDRYLEIRTKQDHDGFAEIFAYPGTIMVKPISGNVVGLRPLGFRERPFSRRRKNK